MNDPGKGAVSLIDFPRSSRLEAGRLFLVNEDREAFSRLAEDAKRIGESSGEIRIRYVF